MSRLVLKSRITSPADGLWDYLKDFSVIGNWNPLVKSVTTDGDGVGSTRTINFSGVGDFVERLDKRDETERVCIYSIINSPLDFKSCRIQIKVKDNGDGTSGVEWSADMNGDPGLEFKSATVFQTLYQGALDNLGLAMSLNRKEDHQ